MLKLYNQTFPSRLLLGTAAYPSPDVLRQSVEAAQPAMITVALRRAQSAGETHGQGFWELLQQTGIPVLPNTAGCQSVQEAVTTAQMAREVFETDWIKLELIGDDDTLQPDVFQLVEAAKILIADGFKVLPYCTEDLIACRRGLPSPDALGRPHRHRFGRGARLRAARVARTPARHAADYRRRLGAALAGRAGDGMGF